MTKTILTLAVAGMSTGAIAEWKKRKQPRTAQNGTKLRLFRVSIASSTPCKHGALSECEMPNLVPFRTDHGFPPTCCGRPAKTGKNADVVFAPAEKKDGASVLVKLAGGQSNFQSPASYSRQPLHLGFIFNQKNTGNVSDPLG